MSKYLTILLILLAGVAKAQTFTPIVGSHHVTISGNECSYFCPADYATCDPADLYFILTFCHASVTVQDTLGMMKAINTSAWDGTVRKWNGDTTRCIIFNVPNFGYFDMSAFEAMVSAGIRSFSRLDTSHHNQFGRTGVTRGADFSQSWFRGVTDYSKVFDRHGVIVQSPASFASYAGLTGNGAWWFYAASDYPATDPTGGNFPSSGNDYEYSEFEGNKKLTNITLGNPANPITDLQDSAFNVAGLNSPTGSTALNNRVRFLIDPDDGIVYETKITGITHKDMIDLSGGSGNPWGYFDEQGADPERGINTPTPITSYPANANLPLYFMPEFGNKWMTGARLRALYHLKKIWYYIETNTYHDDTLYFHKTTDYRNYPVITKVRVPLDQVGWHSLLVDDTVGNVFIGLKPDLDIFGGMGLVNLKEVILYGDQIGEREAATPATVEDRHPLKAIDQILAVNVINGASDMKFFKPFPGGVRYMYPAWVYLDNTSNDKIVNLDHYNEFSWGPDRVTRALIDSQNVYGRHVMFLQSGSSNKFLTDNGFDGPAIDDISYDWFNPASYTASGHIRKTMLQLFGKVVVDTNTITTIGVPKFSGHNMNGGDWDFSNGNELKGFWKGDGYVPDLAYVAQSIADKDSMNTVDPTAILSSASQYEPDTLSIQSLYLLAKEIYGSQPWGRIQMNWYPHGDTAYEHPVKYGFAEKLRNVNNFVKTLYPNAPFQITETSGGDRNITSPQRGPLWKGSGWSRGDQQAFTNFYLLLGGASAGVEHMPIYMAVNNADENSGGGYETTGLFTTYPTESYTPSWYMFSNAMRVMKGYRHDSYIQNTWGNADSLYIQKFRSIAHPDSVCYVVARLSMTNGTSDNVHITVGKAVGAPMLREPSLSSETTTDTYPTYNGDHVTVNLTEKQMFLFVQEAKRSISFRRGARLVPTPIN